MSLSVIPDWFAELSLQQQSVVLLAGRGPDGISKEHPSKAIVRAYRGTVFRAAFRGRFLQWGEHDSEFMSLERFASAPLWCDDVSRYFRSCDDLPHHYIMHLMHGTEILGYKHPNILFRDRWFEFYQLACSDLHLTPETEAEMDERLNDWARQYWN